MLKGIPRIISPELMKTLMEMGHGDDIVLADGNFPAVANARRLIRCDGHTVSDILVAIMPFFPLDHFVDRPVAVMAVATGDARPEVWGKYHQSIQHYEKTFTDFDYVERFAFYERARQSFAIVATSDTAPRANLILKKGVVRQ
jgi:L-fucose mutarotase